MKITKDKWMLIALCIVVLLFVVIILIQSITIANLKKSISELEDATQNLETCLLNS